MSKTFWIIVATGVIGFVLEVWAFAAPGAIVVLLGTLLLVGQALLLLGFLVDGIVGMRRGDPISFAPALACLGSLVCAYYLPSPIGQRISDSRFRKHVAEYSEMVYSFKSGTLKCETACEATFKGLVDSARNEAHLDGMRLVWGERCDDGTKAMLLLLNTDVPLMHEGTYIRPTEREATAIPARRLPRRDITSGTSSGRGFTPPINPGCSGRGGRPGAPLVRSLTAQ